MELGALYPAQCARTKPAEVGMGGEGANLSYAYPGGNNATMEAQAMV